MPVTYDRREGYVLWDMTEWDGDFETLPEREERWLSLHSMPTVDGSVVMLDDDLDLGPEFQDHISERWTELSSQAGVDCLAFVSDRLTAMAVTANMEVGGVDLHATDDVDEAVDHVAS